MKNCLKNAESLQMESEPAKAISSLTIIQHSINHNLCIRRENQCDLMIASERTGLKNIILCRISFIQERQAIFIAGRSSFCDVILLIKRILMHTRRWKKQEKYIFIAFLNGRASNCRVKSSLQIPESTRLERKRDC